MDDNTLTALKASIAHHESHLLCERTEDVKLGPFYCALCRIFRRSDAACGGCPVRDCTGKPNCRETPYRALVSAHNKWVLVGNRRDREAFLIAEQAEIDFLKRLLPEGE